MTATVARALLVLGMVLSASTVQAAVLNIDFGGDSFDHAWVHGGPHPYRCEPGGGGFDPCFSDNSRTLADPGLIGHVSLTATGHNPFSLGELSLSLSHAGVTVDLFRPLTHGGRTATITFDDLAPGPIPNPAVSGIFRPDEPLSAFTGLDASGVWTLSIGDWNDQDPSSYLSAVLTIVTVPEPAVLTLLVPALAWFGFARRRKLH